MIMYSNVKMYSNGDGDNGHDGIDGENKPENEDGDGDNETMCQ